MTESFNTYLERIYQRILEGNEQRVFYRLAVYYKILQQNEEINNVFFASKNLDIKAAKDDLLIYGLVMRRGSYLQIRSRIHKEVFNQKWIKQALINNSIFNSRISFWSQGDQNLVDKLFQLSLDCTTEELDNEETWINLIREQIINGWKNQEAEPYQSWQRIETHILEIPEKDRIQVLTLYQRIIESRSSVHNRFFRRGRESIVLGSGLVSLDSTNKLKIAKNIYSLVFDSDWIKLQISIVGDAPNNLEPNWFASFPDINGLFQYTNNLISNTTSLIYSRLIHIRSKHIILPIIAGIMVLVIVTIPFVESINIFNISYRNNGEIGTVKSLMEDVSNAQKLKTFIQLQRAMTRKSNLLLQEYLKLEPFYNLQHNLQNIYEKNFFKGHKGPIQSIDFGTSLDKQLLVSGGDDGSARLWTLSDNLRELKVIKPTDVDQGKIKFVIFSPTDDFFATVGRKKPTLKFWNFLREPLSTPIPIYDQGAITNIKFSSDGKVLATVGGKERRVKLWKIDYKSESKKVNLIQISQNSSSGSQQSDFYSTSKIVSLDFQPSQNSNQNDYEIAIAYDGSIVRLWDVRFNQQTPSAKEVTHWDTQQNGIRSVNFSPDGTLIAIAGKNGTVKLWDSKGKPRDFILKTGETKDLIISFSRDGKYIITAGEQGKIQFWEWSTNKIKEIKGHEKRIYSISLSQNQNKRYLATGGEDETIRIWEFSKLYEKSWLENQEGIKSIGAGITGGLTDQNKKQRLFIVKEDTIQLWDFEDEENENLNDLRNKSGESISAKSIYISPDRTHFAILEVNGTITLWDFSRENRGTAQVIDTNIENILLGKENSNYLLIVLKRGKASIVRFDSTVETPINNQQYAIKCVDINSERQLIATGDLKDEIRFWDFKAREISQFSPIKANAEVIKFSPDGKFLTIVDSNKRIKLWELPENLSKQPPREVRSFNATGSLVEFSPLDGQFGKLIAIADGSKIELRDLKGRLAAKFEGSWDQTVSLSFSTDGKYIVAAGNNGNIDKWEIQSLDKMVNEACAWLEDYFKFHSEEKEKVCPSNSLA